MSAASIQKMGVPNKTSTQGVQVPSRRRRYKLEMKHKVFYWRKHENLSLRQIQVKFQETFGMTVQYGTLVGFWAGSKKQRPDIVVDLETLLAKNCEQKYVMTGSPYDYRSVRLISLRIFEQLMKTAIYDSKGQRKDKPSGEKEDLTDEACEALGLGFSFEATPGWYRNVMKRNY